MFDVSDTRPSGVSRRAALRMLGAGAAAIAAQPSRALAQDGQPIRIVIAFPPGGTSTATLQPLKEPLGAALGAPIELEYKPGAGGNVAALHVIQSQAGRTHLAVRPRRSARDQPSPPGADRVRRAPRSAAARLVVQYPIVICVAAKHKVANIKEFIDLARRNQLVVGSSGNGSIQHLAYEIFSRVHDVKFIHIPFAGGGPLQQAFERGALDVLFETGSNIVNHVKAGTLRALAVMARERLSILPDVPTVAEAGLGRARRVGVVRAARAGADARRRCGAHHGCHAPVARAAAGPQRPERRRRASSPRCRPTRSSDSSPKRTSGGAGSSATRARPHSPARDQTRSSRHAAVGAGGPCRVAASAWLISRAMYDAVKWLSCDLYEHDL